jgi:hypothetical protein
VESTALDLVKDEWHPQAQGQIGDCRGDLALHLVAEQAARGGRLFMLLGREEKREQAPLALAAFFAPEKVGRDAEQVGQQMPLASIACASPVQRQKGLLTEILRAVTRSGEARKVAHDGIFVAHDQIGESVPVAGHGPGHQLVVARKRLRSKARLVHTPANTEHNAAGAREFPRSRSSVPRCRPRVCRDPLCLRGAAQEATGIAQRATARGFQKQREARGRSGEVGRDVQRLFERLVEMPQVPLDLATRTAEGEARGRVVGFEAEQRIAAGRRNDRRGEQSELSALEPGDRMAAPLGSGGGVEDSPALDPSETQLLDVPRAGRLGFGGA